jgi:hypothetical protein
MLENQQASLEASRQTQQKAYDAQLAAIEKAEQKKIDELVDSYATQINIILGAASIVASAFGGTETTSTSGSLYSGGGYSSGAAATTSTSTAKQASTSGGSAYGGSFLSDYLVQNPRTGQWCSRVRLLHTIMNRRSHHYYVSQN